MAENDGSAKGYTQRVLIAVAVVCLVVLTLVAAYFTFDILLLIFGSGLLAIFLRGLADVLKRWVPLGEGWLVLFVAALLVVVIAGAVALLAPSVAEQVRVLRVEIPKIRAADWRIFIKIWLGTNADRAAAECRRGHGKARCRKHVYEVSAVSFPRHSERSATSLCSSCWRSIWPANRGFILPG